MTLFSWRRLACLCLCLLTALAGCGGRALEPELVWGRKGVQDGDLVKPRAVAIDRHDRLYIVDFTARIQVYDRDGKYLGPTWTTPDYRNGRPSGLSIDRDGNLIVSDSHYHCFRIYSADGEGTAQARRRGRHRAGPARLRQRRGAGRRRLLLRRRVRREPAHHQARRRRQVRQLLGRAGDRAGPVRPRPGPGPRPETATSTSPTPATTASRCSRATASWCAAGASRATAPGQLSYPYDLAFSPKGDVLYVVEYGNHRVQKFTADGQVARLLGRAGPRAGPAAQPVGPGRRQPRAVHVVDTRKPSRAADRLLSYRDDCAHEDRRTATTCRCTRLPAFAASAHWFAVVLLVVAAGPAASAPARPLRRAAGRSRWSAAGVGARAGRRRRPGRPPGMGPAGSSAARGRASSSCSLVAGPHRRLVAARLALCRSRPFCCSASAGWLPLAGRRRTRATSAHGAGAAWSPVQPWWLLLLLLVPLSCLVQLSAAWPGSGSVRPLGRHRPALPLDRPAGPGPGRAAAQQPNDNVTVLFVVDRSLSMPRGRRPTRATSAGRPALAAHQALHQRRRSRSAAPATSATRPA